MGKCLMVQGTGSSVGKSLLVTALCRIFKQDGLRVAPFKSQNMALNSYITKDGGEIGRAQAVQAEACGVDPSVQMNPVLLKPSTDRAAQVIVMGKAIGNMDAVAYHGYKPELRETVRQAYQSLSDAYDAVVIEGAGSPAEINLREQDIVNMGMAQLADAPVILVGDIDKGGVFASLYGTVKLLEPCEQQRIKGILINKFRGDVKLLDSGIRMLEDLIGIPVLGVIPYLDLDIEEEDSVCTRLNASKRGEIDIAVIRLKRLSNFTDFDALAREEGVSLRYVSKVSELGSPDAILLPGSKNTLQDMQAIRREGLSQAIEEHARQGKTVFGICAGYQMLGRLIKDPHHMESDACEAEGLGLLDMTTTMEKEKITCQVRAELTGEFFGCRQDDLLTGYEIHLGRNTWGETARPFTKLVSRNDESVSEPDGMMNAQGNVFGTYLHGIFENAAFTRGFVNALRAQKQLCPLEGEATDHKQYKEAQYDLLAQHIRQCVDMQAVYRILEGI